jgi:hypothetical protein
MLLAIAAIFFTIWLGSLGALQRPPADIHAFAVLALGCVAAHFYLLRRTHFEEGQSPDLQRERASLLKKD